jgi:hypothetical protein
MNFLLKLQFDLSKQTHGSHGGADYKIFFDFFNICRNGGTPRSDLRDGRLAVQMSIAATQSDDTHSLIKIDN